MDKVWIGITFLVLGLLYASLMIDRVYDATLGWLIENNWVKVPVAAGKDELRAILGRKPTILLYSLFLISIGIFIIWNRNS